MSELSKNHARNNILKLGSKNLNSESWEVYHPNGTHMFTCGEKKATWYLERDLAERMSDGKIMLNFEPKGGGFKSDEVFGKTVRKTICVVTGVADDLQRHHIVPYCYRAFFPEKYKSKNHHDVVLINYKKHSQYEIIATEYKDVIAKKYNLKTINELNTEYTSKIREFGKDNAILLNKLHFIFKTYGKVSREMKIEKLHEIAETTGIDFEIISNYNYIQLYKLYLILKQKHVNELHEFKQNNRYVYDHGYHIMKKLDTEKKIMDFVKLWRRHFIETMKPKFMPEG